MSRPLYSHSRLSSFENCPRQFYFRYVAKLPAESEGIEAFVGKRVHEVLERLHEFADRGQVPSLAKVLQRFTHWWDEHFDAERVRIVRQGLDPAHYRELGERCLRNYYQREYPFDQGETLGIEERVVFPLDERGSYRMQGIVDRITRRPDGTIEIIDYKTGQYVPSQKRLDEDRQLALYQLGLSERYPGSPIRLVWHYVARNRVVQSERTPEQLDELRHKTIAVIDAIEAEDEFPARKIKLCDWCEYKSICPLWADETTASAAAAQPDAATPATAPATAPAEGSTERDPGQRGRVQTQMRLL